MDDRSSPRTRPSGWPIALQKWDKLLFLHWPVPVEQLRPKIPERLSIDTYEGTAWVGMTPFTLWGTRPPLMPTVPVLGRSHELNVRTYVHLDGVPGVWFFSLEACNPLAVLGARVGFSLPYYQAFMSLRERDGRIDYFSRRLHPGAPSAEFKASWRAAEPLPELQPGTLDFFLIERYCLYTTRGGTLYQSRIFHRRWPLRQAALIEYHSTVLESHGISPSTEEPLTHCQAAPLKVEIWPLRKV